MWDEQVSGSLRMLYGVWVAGILHRLEFTGFILVCTKFVGIGCRVRLCW